MTNNLSTFSTSIDAKSAITTGPRMNGKPVFTIPTKTVINFDSGFRQKKLCDGLTFSAGSACAYSCTFCYVGAILYRNKDVRKVLRDTGLQFSDVVLRRERPVETVCRVLAPKVTPKFSNPSDTRTVYASPLVDVAANVELADETLGICLTILALTHWQMRLLSKSPLIVRIADNMPAQFQGRMIYGLSTGTLDDEIARAIENGTPPVSKRLEALKELQDRRLRTYGMLCPILPQANPEEYARRVAASLRVDQCEHVWAEVLNVRGSSMARTYAALRQAGFDGQAALLQQVANDGRLWEEYARQTFLALSKVVPPHKLRFLQYVKRSTVEWWRAHESSGAVLLGKAAEDSDVGREEHD